MSKKVVNIITFVIAGIACLLALWFSINFDDSKKALYHEVNNIRSNNSRMLSDFESVTLSTLPDFVSAKSDEYEILLSEFKSKQYQRDVFYTYIVDLKDLNEDNFSEYKSQFPQRANQLFARSKDKDDFTAGFLRVNDYASLQGYISSLEKGYESLRQQYLHDKAYVRSFGNLLKRIHDINNVVSESKKVNDLSTLQSDIKSSGNESVFLNLAVTFVYIVFFVAIAIVLIFSILGIVLSIKSSYQILLWASLLVLIFVIAYFASSPVLSKSAIAMGHTGNEVKWIEAGLILFYTLLFGAIISIIVSPFINKIKKI